MPAEPADPVVTAACFFCCRRAMGEAINPAFPAPSVFSRVMLMQSSDANCAAGSLNHVTRHCERSEAIQNASAETILDCFVASLLAMTTRRELFEI
jgi:hypothetical protein